MLLIIYDWLTNLFSCIKRLSNMLNDQATQIPAIEPPDLDIKQSTKTTRS